ncbi:MAG TPA: ATP-binding protein [Sulfuricurvum sp.]|nr:MAG: hypothetical protein B7Y30_04495 [Campylobacterales bacterium 16-40-21]OZA02631.1 MAG: hypothetical protein B7X89_08350 [Sulfuricurvum sp. 17-40-25]HQS67407.1 ATP-binding protein [Sulfuricurvum sp.]HQT36447.1 ATP-binding protein [Sulfuricurvum sp.]
MHIKQYSITSQITLSLVVTSIAILFFGTLFHLWHTLNHEKTAFKTKSALETQLIANMTAAPLAFLDIQGIDEQLEYLNNNDDVISAIVYDSRKIPLAYGLHTRVHSIPDTLPYVQNSYHDTSWKPWIFGNLTTTIEIKENEELLGYLSIERKSDNITQFLLNMLFFLSIFSFFLLTLVYFSARHLSKKILQPVLDLSHTAQNIADTNNYALRVSYKADNEISSLYRSFNHLLEETQSLTANLEKRVAQRTKELEFSLETLQKTQVQMVQSEKMAALGSLVSGVAHEVNTPLGNAITGGSIILKESKNLLASMEAGTLKKSSMDHGLHILNETAQVMMRSLEHAADLIRSFKRVSVDQASENAREFNLYDYLQEILLTFHNKLKKIPIAVTLQGDQTLILNSYPGVYAQIISNFIQNSLLHAFNEKIQHPTIVIHYEVVSDSLVVTYSDNGLGMDAKIRPVAFEPFTTTKRNSGGSGLGLNIVYNLITQKLQGKVQLESKPNEGTKYTFTVPLLLKK